MKRSAGLPLLLLITSCGGGSNSPATSGPVTQPASSASSAPSATPTEKPLSFYAAQYQRIGKPCVDAQEQLRASKTNDQAIKRGVATAKACQSSNALLLRAEWPPIVKADIRAEVLADGAVIADLGDLENNGDSLVRDSGPANAAANVTRADLGLPAIS